MNAKLNKKLNQLTENPGTVLSTALIVAATGLATRQVISNAWRVVNNEEPPLDPSHPDVDWRSALAWTTAVGFTVGLTRLIARRALHVDPRA